MKPIFLKLSIPVLLLFFFFCGSKPINYKFKKNNSNITVTDSIAIVHKDTNYEIIIIDAGFNIWLQSMAKARNYYSQSYLEISNRNFVTNWNIKVNQSSKNNEDLYIMNIDYDSNTNYGYEVNYLLYNYFIYFQEKYHQNIFNAL